MNVLPVVRVGRRRSTRVRSRCRRAWRPTATCGPGSVPSTCALGDDGGVRARCRAGRGIGRRGDRPPRRRSPPVGRDASVPTPGCAPGDRVAVAAPADRWYLFDDRQRTHGAVRLVMPPARTRLAARVVAAARSVPPRRASCSWSVRRLLTVGLALFDADLVTDSVYRGRATSPSSADDPIFLAALRNSLIFIVGAVPLRVAAALGLALLLHRSFRGAGAYRTAVYLPTVVPDVAFALAWLWILNPLYGPLNLTLGGDRRRRSGVALRPVGGPFRADHDQRLHRRRGVPHRHGHPPRDPRRPVRAGRHWRAPGRGRRCAGSRCR